MNSKNQGNWVRNEDLLKILDRVPVGIAMFSISGDVLFINKRFRKILTELGVSSFSGKEISKFFKPETAGSTSIISVGKRVFGYSVYRVGSFFVITTKDISEKEFSLSLELEKKEVDLINYLFTMIRHEIGNPINAIKFTLSVMKENADDFTPEKLKEYIDRLMVSVSELEKILAVMKDYSKFGKVVLHPVNLNKLLKKFIFLIAPLIKQKGIDFIFKPMNRDIYIKGDPTAIEQVLVNIVKNSIEALEDNGKPRKRIYISVQEELDKVFLIVQDNGKGIPEEVKEYLFFPFFSTKKTGSGMGLALCKGFMTAMGGKILIESKEGEGTRVTLIFQKAEK